MRKEIIGDCILYCGDCYEIIKDIPDKSIDLIYTDPPYKIHSGVQKAKMYIEKGINKQQEKLVKANISNSFDYGIFEEFIRVCKNINFQVWCSKKQYIEYLQMADKNKWKWQDICLYRNNALPNVNGKYQDKDYLVHLWEGRKLTGTYHQKVTDYHWNIGGKKEYNHPALKPIEPIMNLIEIGSDEVDTVLDPFMGSGSTAIACIKTNRKFIGIEIDEDYFNMAVERINKELNIEQKNKSKIEQKDRILAEMRNNANITTTQLMETLNLGKTSIQNYIKELTTDGLIERVGGKNGGHWKVNK